MVMGRFKRFISELFGGLALILLVHAQDQSDFISIDCGLPENSSYTERRTGVDYISDAGFIDSGINGQISTEFKGDLQQQVWSLRSFPEGIRNCYSIRITQGTKYLIRATFFYGNYDGESKLPEFDVHLGANMWNTIKITNVSDGFVKELIHVPPLNYIQLCLVNTQRGTPFISAIELRPLPNSTYVTTDGSLERFWRVDVGSESNLQYRYKDDVCDRIWWPYNYEEWTGLSTSLPIEEWTGLSTTLTIESPSSNPYRPPSVVMSTATTPINDSASLNFHWYAEDATSKYYIYMHFAEVVKLKANKSRSFNVMLNGKHMNGPIMPDYLSAFTLYSEGALTPTGEKYVFSLIKTENSTLPPIINAIEVYSVKNLLQSETDQEDVGAITKIKSTYGVKRNWQGDPCAPQAYLWEGLNCSYDGYNAPRVISLNLSSSELTGAISADISTLVMLQYLDLSNNSLTGSVPDFLSQLQYLEVLNLERNQFNGSIPAELIKRSKSGSLLLSVGENSNLCASDSCERKKLKNNIVVLILASVVGLLILSLTIAAIFCGLTRRKKQDKTRVALVDTEPNVQNRPLESMQRQVTYSDLQRITNNFERILGKGGFGTVYYGCMDGIRVAVKVFSPSSVQGYQQFQAEVKLLVRVHHKNLTTLVGYCYEGTNMGLVYEYMANRDLEAQLSGHNTNILNWQARLQIAIDAAEGLEYLHHGCKPSIIHRDVKTTNILLNEKFNAKLGDFGLSKIFQTDSGTHVSTNVVGTPGYLDPEYYKSNWLNEKSDVYSFGVVLLKIITNRPVIGRSQDRTHISQWVSFMLAKGDIQNIVDPRLGGDFDVNSVWKAVEVAVVCVSPTSSRRPTMSQVVAELKESLTTELSQKMEGYGVELKDSFDMINMDLDTELNPLAR
ncbi:LRR receptor-like serine/threonine-protein kinase IOS1 isoform X2 [Quercus suber]|uniref:LRR receptor-like serine/threonine-protein kinase IOS1 isoform X2 n=1 Tax=Quercus suber TaxID=58331 RepID=UPI000D2A4ABE|nr:putative lrr receptor-like serine/threonine-protein kinase [Quercus suber]